VLKRCAYSVLVLFLWCSAAHALQPDQIALIVNDKAPGSRELAEFYALQRHIPDGRIIAISIDQQGAPFPREEIPFADYEPTIAGPVRDFLTKNGLKDRVKCLVSFWGVPLRIAARVSTPEEQKELSTIQTRRADVLKQLEAGVAGLESLAAKVRPNFAPTTQPLDIDAAQKFSHRAELASVSTLAGLTEMPADAKRAALVDHLTDLMALIGGKPKCVQRMAVLPLSRLTTRPVSPDELANATAQLEDIRHRLAPLNIQSPVARAGQRQLTRDYLGLLNEIHVLDEQYRILNPEQTESAMDSELALIWWGNYPRFRWQANPLCCRYTGSPLPVPTLMVMRIDAPTLALAHSLITTSIEVEQRGLQGQVAIDARGLLPSSPYGVYDQGLRNLAFMLRKHTKLKISLDDREALFPAQSLDDVALYCGWYSLRRYVQPGRFSAGAVGFHVASFELVGLHAPEETGWVKGLITDGVVATLGPVAEPYLQTFPRADDFFPLLLTGKLTLAEVYWRTTPMASWMQDCIGDPLYRPYAANPALAAEDLPEVLRQAIER
jgi:uncharacterized protein (TIGR03790 family)